MTKPPWLEDGTTLERLWRQTAWVSMHALNEQGQRVDPVGTARRLNGLCEAYCAQFCGIPIETRTE